MYYPTEDVRSIDLFCRGMQDVRIGNTLLFIILLFSTLRGGAIHGCNQVWETEQINVTLHGNASITWKFSKDQLQTYARIVIGYWDQNFQDVGDKIATILLPSGTFESNPSSKWHPNATPNINLAKGLLGVLIENVKMNDSCTISAMCLDKSQTICTVRHVKLVVKGVLHGCNQVWEKKPVNATVNANAIVTWHFSKEQLQEYEVIIIGKWDQNFQDISNKIATILLPTGTFVANPLTKWYPNVIQCMDLPEGVVGTVIGNVTMDDGGVISAMGLDSSQTVCVVKHLRLVIKERHLPARDKPKPSLTLYTNIKENLTKVVRENSTKKVLETNEDTTRNSSTKTDVVEIKSKIPRNKGEFLVGSNSLTKILALVMLVCLASLISWLI